MIRNLLLSGFVKPIGRIVDRTPEQYNFLPFFKKKLLNKNIIPHSFLPVIIPGNKLVLKIFYGIPLSSGKTLDNLLHYKIDSDVLPDIRKLNYFYIVLNKNIQKKEQAIAVFFYQEESLHEYNSLLQKYHLTPEKYIFDVNLFLKYAEKISSDSPALIILNFDSYSYMGIRNKNGIQYLRIVNSPVSEIKKSIQDTIQYYKKISADETINTVIMINSPHEIQIKPFSIINMKWDEDKFIAMAFRSSVPSIIPEEMRRTVLFHKVIKKSFQAGLCFIFAALILLSLNIHYIRKNASYRSKMKGLQSSLAVIRPLQEKQKELTGILSRRSKFIPEQSIISAELMALTRMIPSDIRLKSLNYEKETLLYHLDGYASGINEINQLMEKLNNSFSKVQLIATEQEKFGEKNLINFRIKFSNGEKKI